MLTTLTLNGQEVMFEERGYKFSKYTVVLFPGLCHDPNTWKYIYPFLIQKYRVITLIWKGHGTNRDPAPEWKIEDMVSNTISLMDALEVGAFIPLTHSMGSWAAMDIAEKLGKQRVPAMLLTDLIMGDPGSDYYEILNGIQNPKTWFEYTKRFFDGWLPKITNPNIIDAFYNHGGGHNYHHWANSAVLAKSQFMKWGSAQKRLELIKEPPLVRHAFSHPDTKENISLQQEMAEKHCWFTFAQLFGETHFPTMEIPESVALQLNALIRLLEHV
ncbi:hypothetical protein RBB50_001133 [Rhinocladiella similis]